MKKKLLLFPLRSAQVDNPDDATIGAFLLCELMLSLSSSEDLDDEIHDIIQEYEERSKRAILHTLSFY